MDTPPPFSPPKRWQFSLRSLLLVTTGAAIMLGVGGTRFVNQLLAWSAVWLPSYGVAIALATFAFCAVKIEHRILLAAGAVGAWNAFYWMPPASASNNLLELAVLSFQTLIGSVISSAMAAAIAWQTLKFARNRGWSRI